MPIWRSSRIILHHAFRRLRYGGGAASRVLQLAGVMGIVVFLLTLNTELTQGPQRYMRSVPVSHWIVETDTDSIASNGFVEPGILTQLQNTGYHADGLFVYFGKLHGAQMTYQSYDPQGPLQPQLAAGRQVQQPGEAVVDQVLASETGLQVGDTFDLKGQTEKVVGLSRETNGIIREATFINHQDMQRVVGFPAYVAIAVQLAPGQPWPPVGIDTARYKFPTHVDFTDSNTAVETETIAPFFFMTIIAVITLTLGIITLSLKNDIDASARQLGMMRAVGASIGQLRRTEGTVLAIIAIIASALGTVVAVALIMLANGLINGLTASVSTGEVVFGTLSIGLVCLLALLMSLRRIRRRSTIAAIASS